MKAKVTNIEWDVDDPKDLENLPKEVTVVVEVDEEEMDEVDLIIGDYLSDLFGFCHNGFSYTILNK